MRRDFSGKDKPRHGACGDSTAASGKRENSFSVPLSNFAKAVLSGIWFQKASS